jgi:redox-sensitive bicupin YhaK (pirin superfamily)
MTARTVLEVVTGRPTSDGGGVRLTRVISPEQGLDPFLLLDEFDSSSASDYIAGFPSHPHRGFETVTYMLDGHMLHEDHLGHRGDLKPGAVQWMTAGRGIIHSEMPQQVAGRMRGFQLWINLPGAEKMKPAAYQDLEPERMPRVEQGGATVRVVAGEIAALPGTGRPPVVGPISGGATRPLYLDVALEAEAALALATPAGHNVIAYVFEGEATVGDESRRPSSAGFAVVTRNRGEGMASIVRVSASRERRIGSWGVVSSWLMRRSRCAARRDR